MANLPGSIKNLNTLLGEQLAEGGGGGGSSDFSTATLTLNNPTEQFFSAPFIAFTSAGAPFDFIVSNGGSVSSGDYTIALYKGNAMAIIPLGNIETSGAIESLGDSQYHITGDCTITIS